MRHCVAKFLPEWGGRDHSPPGLRNTGSSSLWPMGRVFCRHAECLPVIRLLWNANVLWRNGLRTDPQCHLLQLPPHGQHPAGERRHYYAAVDRLHTLHIPVHPRHLLRATASDPEASCRQPSHLQRYSARYHGLGHPCQRGAGNLVSPAVTVPKSQIGFIMAHGITSVAGTYTGGSERVSDWTRYAKHRHSPTLAQLTALPITVTLVALIGIVTTSACAEILGQVEWNPMIMLQTIQVQYYTAACRAGTFFAGVGLLSVTVFINYTQNCVSSGMDLAMLVPRWVSRRRGSIIFALLGILANPWRFLTQATTFITVLSSFGVFMSPAAAVLVVDFWLVRRTKWNIPDLYTPDGIYWFWNGVNWRAVLAYFLGMAWGLPGFIMDIGGPPVSEGWYHLYQISFFFGYGVSGGIYYVFNLLFPPPGLGAQVDISLAEGNVVLGISATSHLPERAENEKQVRLAEEKA
ncbi:hypothetical protein PG995_001088 [Apiospora arundinis]